MLSLYLCMHHLVFRNLTIKELLLDSIKVQGYMRQAHQGTVTVSEAYSLAVKYVECSEKWFKTVYYEWKAEEDEKVAHAAREARRKQACVRLAIQLNELRALYNRRRADPTWPMEDLLQMHKTLKGLVDAMDCLGCNDFFPRTRDDIQEIHDMKNEAQRHEATMATKNPDGVAGTSDIEDAIKFGLKVAARAAAELAAHMGQ